MIIDPKIYLLFYYIQQSTNPPASPLPTQPVVYADIQQSTNPPAAPPPTQPVVYAEVKQSTNPPAAPPSTQPVVYADVKMSPESTSQVVSFFYIVALSLCCIRVL